MSSLPIDVPYGRDGQHICLKVDGHGIRITDEDEKGAIGYIAFLTVEECLKLDWALQRVLRLSLGLTSSGEVLQ